MSDHPLGLSGEEYWTEPFKNQRTVFSQTVSRFQRALLVDVSPEVELGRHKDLAAPLVYSRSMKEAASVRFEDVTVVVATRLEDRATSANLAFLPFPRTEEGGDDVEPDEETFVGRTAVIDLHDRLTFTRMPGTFLATVLIRDLASNRVRLSVRPSSTGFVDEEVQRFIDARRRQGPWIVEPAEGADLPRYDRLPGSPALPEGAGLALAVERVVAVGDGRPAVVYGSFRVPVLAGEIVPPPAALAAVPGTARRPSAIVPVTLLVTSSDDDEPAPHTLTLRCPVFDRIAPGGEGTEVTGHFAVDVFGIRGVERGPATLFVYGFAGEAMSGPHMMGMVTDRMLGR